MVKAFSTPCLVEPLAHGLFRVGLLKAAHGGQIATAESVFEEISHALELGRGFGLAAVAQAELLQTQEILAELRGGALGGGAGIVELVHEAGGEGAKGDELFAMQRFNLIGLKALRRCRRERFCGPRGSRQGATRNPARRSGRARNPAMRRCGNGDRPLPVSKGTSPKASPACAMPTRVKVPSASGRSA